MATRKDKTLRPQLITLFNLGVIRELTDGQLLERFVTDRGEMAELAFAALVERHSAMVMRVCRARLSSSHDAQDAFQATFLLLVKKARTLWVQDSLGPWLHQVALRTATCSRKDAARRQRLERHAAELAESVDQPAPEIDSELGALLHEAINRLPERYRIPIILCDLEGRTCEEAARRMGRPVGTVKSWRARGRERLRVQLIRDGLAPSATLEATLAADLTRGAIPKPEAETVRAAARIQANSKATGDVPASVGLLIKGVMKAMLLSKLRATVTILCALSLFAAGLGTMARVAADDAKDTPTKPLNEAPPPASILKPRLPSPIPKVPGGEPWPLTLGEALHIGLDNSEVIRLLGASDDRYEIIPLNPALNIYRFQSEVMAHVRSIEQQYWSLALQHVQLWSSEKAVELAEEFKKRKESERKNGTGIVADVAKASQRLEQFRLDARTKISDIITTERRLRNALGLPKADGRRIVPVSQLKTEKVSPDWNTSLANMLEKQPDVAHVISELEASKGQNAAANCNLMLDSLLRALRGQGELVPSPDEVDAHLSLFLKENPSLQEVIHQTTESLARSFLEINTNYKQLHKASEIRSNAAKWLEAQRAFYEEGRIARDRYLDGISQYAAAVAQEAQFKSSYYNSRIALEEAQGTLLEHEKITVGNRPSGATAIYVKRDPATMPAWNTNRAFVSPLDGNGPQPHPILPAPVQAESKSPKPSPLTSRSRSR
ncbi:sigma-70 family RNA polymerase sigma factor [Singulisphaera sp. Ch08]|uniref:Sigma-70 family RNA polymerase sigma factor n=1 Tax=Singulisphaera sp. Ch08 TaxID=3120278 RepID=A0AAU7CKZ6_9BACT